MTGILITVAAMDLAQLILAASEKRVPSPDETAINNVLAAAEELVRLRKDLMDVLGVHAQSDTELVDLVRDHVRRSQLGGDATNWTCPNCTASVTNDKLVCPTCVPVDEPATQRGLHPVPVPPPTCGAHGETECGLCTLNPAECAYGNGDGCGTYQNTGMHWHGCPHRAVKVTGAGALVLADGRVVGYQNNDPDMVHDVLSLVDVSVPDEEVQSWTAEQRKAVIDWASVEHLSASDNLVPRLERPGFLPPEARHADRSALLKAPMVSIDEHGQAREYTLSDVAEGQETDRG